MKIKSYAISFSMDRYGACSDMSPFKSLFNSVLKDFEWDESSEIVEEQLSIGSTSSTGKLYLKLVPVGAKYSINVSVYSIHNGSYHVASPMIVVKDSDGNSLFYINGHTAESYGSDIFYLSIAQTEYGIAINSACKYNGRDYIFVPCAFRLWTGTCRTPTGEVKQGIVLSDRTTTDYYCWNEDMSKGTRDTAFCADISNTNEACLAPVTNSSTGDVYEHIFMMIASPVSCAEMKIGEADKTYICGDYLCMEE